VHFADAGQCSEVARERKYHPAAATPKLIDICCMVLAMELAALVSWSVVSA
jgi:hypothetical protein